MPEEKQEQIIIINPKEQVETLIQAEKLAELTTKYERRKNETQIWFNEGREQGQSPILAEYLKRAEEKIIEKRMDEIIQEARSMIETELNNIKEILG